jgi:hypothetical protein
LTSSDQDPGNRRNSRFKASVLGIVFRDWADHPRVISRSCQVGTPGPGAGDLRVTGPVGRSPDCAAKASKSAMFGVLACHSTQTAVPEGSAFGQMLPPRPRHQMVVWFDGPSAGLPGAVRGTEPSGTGTSVDRLSGRLADRMDDCAASGRCSRRLLDGDIPPVNWVGCGDVLGRNCANGGEIIFGWDNRRSSEAFGLRRHGDGRILE